MHLPPQEPPPLPDPEAAIRGALSRPLGQPALDRFVEPGDRVVVASTDEAASAWLLPSILRSVREAGASSVSLRDSVRGSDPVPLGWAPSGMVRLDRQLAEADRIVLAGTAPFDALATLGGDLVPLGEVLPLAPPAFLVEIALQRGGRPAAVFAGDPVRAHEAAMAFLSKWRQGQR